MTTPKTNKVSHTPTPQDVVAALAKGYTVEDFVQLGISEGSAAFIVLAVNEYQHLKDCREEMLQALKAAQAHLLNADVRFHDDVLCRQMGSAIAKAEGVAKAPQGK